MSIAPFALLLAAFAPSVWATQTNPATWTLARVLNQVAQRSPAVLAAHAGVDEAKAHVGQARAHWFGTVDLYTISNHYNVPMLIQPITAFPPRNCWPQARSAWCWPRPSPRQRTR